MIVIPFVQGKVHQVVLERVLGEHPEARAIELPRAPAEELGEASFAFAGLLRELWPEPGDLVVVEHDYLPPPGAIQALLDCGHNWCTHPAWIHDTYLVGSLNLARFSAALKAREPDLMDYVAAPNPWWSGARTGVGEVSGRGLPARFGYRRELRCLRPGETDPWPDGDPSSWPTSRHWRIVDTGIVTQMRRRGVKHHTHYPPGRHLHDYGPGQQERWSERPPVNMGITITEAEEA